MKYLSKITIVIPSYNRPKYLIRQLHFWKAYNAQVIILDGSEQSWDINNDESIPNNIQYHHLPVSIEKRLSFIKTLIQTPYSV